MTILLRKIAGEGRALIRSDSRVLHSPQSPSMFRTLGAFIATVLPVIVLLALTVLGLHFAGDSGLLLAAAPLLELKAKRTKLVKEANDALTASQVKAKAESRGLSEEEKAADNAYQAKIEALDEEIQLEERKLSRERGNPSAERGTERDPVISGVRHRAEDDSRRGFRSHREFLLSVMENSGLKDRADVGDERLRALAVADKEDKKSAGELAFMLPSGFTPQAAAGSDEQGEYANAYGGFATRTTRLAGLLEVGFEGDPTEGLTQAIPMETNSVEIMARTDKDHTTSVVGGLTMTRKPETVAATASRLQLEMITMKATSLFGLAYASEELLQDSPSSFAAIIDGSYRTQRASHLLNEKLRGGGGSEYLGVLNSPAKVSVSKVTGQAADTINGQNVIEMASRIWGAFIWLANHDTRPELYKLSIPTGVGAQLIFQPARDLGFPDMLLGRPVFYTEHASTLGDEGDLMGVNWSQYLEGIYSPLQSAESIHVRFVNHERAFKLWERNAGAPWWRAPLTPAKSAKTLSPIVTLAARA